MLEDCCCLSRKTAVCHRKPCHSAMYMAQLSLPRAPIELTHMRFVYPHLTAADSKSRLVCLVYRFFMTQLLFRGRIKFMIVHLWNWYIWTSFLYFCILYVFEMTTLHVTFDCRLRSLKRTIMTFINTLFWGSAAASHMWREVVFLSVFKKKSGVASITLADHQPLLLLNYCDLQHCVKC